jgi:hypothetical protein
VPVRNENTGGATGWCLEPHDLWVSKAVAGRPNDIEFCRALLRSGYVDATVLHERLRVTPVEGETLRFAQELARAPLSRRGETDA